MEFDNSFDVALPPAEAWVWLLDIERIATCLPGAELTEVVDAQTYKGRVGVRLGPVSLSFVGQAKLEQTDAAAHHARMHATGADSKGRGGTTALIDFALEPIADGAHTRVRIHSNVTLTGSVAQYGRGAGMIQSVAAQLIGQFGACLQARIEQTRAQATDVEQTPDNRVTVAETTDAAAPVVGSVADASHRAQTMTGAPPKVGLEPAARPISGFALLARALFASLRRLFGGRPSA